MKLAQEMQDEDNPICGLADRDISILLGVNKWGQCCNLYISTGSDSSKKRLVSGLVFVQMFQFIVSGLR